MPLFAERWETSLDTAARALHRLHERGLLGCLQGEGRVVRGEHHGGRGADVWFLTPCGARVISAHLGLDPAGRVREPRVAKGDPVPTASGVWKYKDATAQSRTLIAHDLACVRLALRESCFDADSPWVLRRRIRFTPPYTTREYALVPDFAIPLVVPSGPEYARVQEPRTCYVEVEGTDEAKHITAKHHGYAALTRALRHERGNGQLYARAYATELTLLIVMNFAPGEERQRRHVLRRHLTAYANRSDGANYAVRTIDLKDVLAAPADVPVWRLGARLDYDKERDRLKGYWRRQPMNADTGDYER